MVSTLGDPQDIVLRRLFLRIDAHSQVWGLHHIRDGDPFFILQKLASELVVQRFRGQKDLVLFCGFTCSVYCMIGVI